MINRKCKYTGENVQNGYSKIDRKSGIKYIFALLFAILVFSASPAVTEYSAAAEEHVETDSVLLEQAAFPFQGIEVVSLEAATRTEVKKLAAALNQKREFVLKIRTNGEKPEKLLCGINKKLRKINKAGVVLNFGPDANKGSENSGITRNYPTEENGCYYVYISEDNAKTYCGAVELISRMFTEAKKNKCSVKTGDKSFANAQTTLAKASCMSELSDAMKLYAIAASGYFTCTRVSNGFNMTYNQSGRGSYDACGSRAELVTTLLAGKATGVCEEYAKYEVFVFSLLGIEAYCNKSMTLNHAWSVARVTNSAGKVMWVPFDYDIGPSYTLSRTAFDPSNTAEMKNRYRIYLEGILGAPSVKNFENSDFK